MTAATIGRHRRRYSCITQSPPDAREKFSYLPRSLPYLALSVTLVAGAAFGSQLLFEANSHLWMFAAFTGLGLVAFVLSAPLALTGRGFDGAAHRARVRSWHPLRYPTVDVYLPCCGEPADMARNSWAAAAAMIGAYPGQARGYVLDDAGDPQMRALAEELRLAYIVRPNRGEHKKSGNLRHAFRITSGEVFVVLDTDFAPRPDFLAETLPYFDDPDIAIVQTPQFFRSSEGQTWVEQAAGAVQELFYRAIQTGRDRLGASICVGTCAVYRRKALEPQGGTTLIAYAEDVHTGLDVRRDGWRLAYVPVVLAAGMCPPGLSAFVRQQYRWATGSTSTILTSRLWTVPMSVAARCTYVSGFAYYCFTGLSVFAVPLFPLTLLVFRPWSITPLNSGLIIVSMLTSMAVLPLWHKASYDLRATLPLSLARSWAHALAIWDYLRGKTQDWQPTGGAVSPVRRFFWGVRLWNLPVAVAWVGLALWRMTSIAPGRLIVVTICGLIQSAVVLRVIFPGRDAR